MHHDAPSANARSRRPHPLFPQRHDLELLPRLLRLQPGQGDRLRTDSAAPGHRRDRPAEEGAGAGRYAGIRLIRWHVKSLPDVDIIRTSFPTPAVTPTHDEATRTNDLGRAQLQRSSAHVNR